MFCDSDFAGCKETTRFTSGVFLALVGPSTFIPLSAVSKRQTAASHSTPEAEIVAADLGIRTEGLPALCLWEVLLDRTVLCVLCEDNEAGIRILETGRNPTIRHLGRVHKVGIAFLHECYERGDVIMQYTPTDRQSADIFTKCFFSPKNGFMLETLSLLPLS